MDKDEDLQLFAQKALGGYRSIKDPINLQRLMADHKPDNLYHALVALRPEWGNFVVPPREEFIALAEGLLYLPPVGGKVEAPTDRRRYFSGALDPSMTIEEQINQLTSLRQKGRLPQFPEGYIHQLTVQGRLPDPFKYAALSLILHSPYRNDWSKPFFEAEWGQIAPMIHDGGNVDPGVNPIWRWTGRTDFLQRIVPVFQPNLEQLEQLSPEERSKQSVDELAKARYEQEERDRLLIEAKAYQRLALALHSKVDTAPIPGDVASRLAGHWDSFVHKMDRMLEEYDINGTAKVAWFTDKPVPEHSLAGYGDRYEAPWKPIQKELIHLESVRMLHPELRGRVRQILQETTDNIDREIGL